MTGSSLRSLLRFVDQSSWAVKGVSARNPAIWVNLSKLDNKSHRKKKIVAWPIPWTVETCQKGARDIWTARIQIQTAKTFFAKHACAVVICMWRYAVGSSFSRLAHLPFDLLVKNLLVGLPLYVRINISFHPTFYLFLLLILKRTVLW